KLVTIIAHTDKYHVCICLLTKTWRWITSSGRLIKLIMKKTLIIIFGVFVFLLAAAVAVPILFKDKIVARIDREIAQTVNAKVIYDVENISLGIFRRFPNISATLKDLDIVGNAPFENDTLVSLQELAIDFNLKSILFEDYPTLTGVHLNGGNLYIKVLE